MMQMPTISETQADAPRSCRRVLLPMPRAEEVVAATTFEMPFREDLPRSSAWIGYRRTKGEIHYPPTTRSIRRRSEMKSILATLIGKHPSHCRILSRHSCPGCSPRRPSRAKSTSIPIANPSSSSPSSRSSPRDRDRGQRGLRQEGNDRQDQGRRENNPADAVLTVDIGRLDGLVRAELLEPVESQVLNANIPASLRHPDGLWFGLTTRARVVYAHQTRVGADEVLTTADLADPKLKGRICSRSGSMATTSRSSPASSPATARRRRRNGSRG